MSILNIRLLFLFCIIVSCGSMDLIAQDHMHGVPDITAEYLMQQASGTALQPASGAHHMLAKKAGAWTLMFHGLAHVNTIVQSGPRGGDRFFSTNWFMGTATRTLGNGSFELRSMISLDPLTVTDRQYPLLFQTGETAFGEPIVDGQHPHDLFMELSVQYVLRISEDTVAHFYFAPVGDPALGPVAFPHRISAAELPQATLSHHLQDSSHIVNEVVTAGVRRGIIDWEISGFHGAEPNENRWNFDHGAIDSWSTRLQLNPNPDWSGQISIGNLKKPEALEEEDIRRTTASITYNHPAPEGNWATSFIWGQNHKKQADRNLNSYLLESVYQFRQKNYLTGRLEIVDKDELFHSDEILAGQTFRINAFTAGYTRDFNWIKELQTGIGGNFSFYAIPNAIKPFYGDHPVGAFFYLRIRQKSGHSEAAGHYHH